MRLIERPWLRTAFLVLVVFSLLAGDAWRYSIGWAGFSVIVVLVAAASIVLLVVQRARWKASQLPYPLIAFLLLATASLIWSFYPGATALGLTATWITVTVAVAVAVTFSWAEILRGLAHGLRLVLGLSLLFELVVAVIIRKPVLPIVPAPGIDYATLDKIPKMLYWSRNELFDVLDGGKIQGIVGNSALLSFVALLGIIVFGLQFFDRTVKRRWSIVWLVVAVACFVLTRAATNIVGLVTVAFVAVAILLVRRSRSPRATAITYAGIVAVILAGVAIALVFSKQLLAVLGKTPDLTNRTDIWAAVIHLAQQRPVIGWGWVSYWVPWVAPFDTLAFNNGVRQLHAHDAWLDIWLQLGIVGLVVFGALVLSTFARSWAFAADRPQSAPGTPAKYTSATLLPVLVVTALIVQSVAESRLLVEYGLFLLVLAAVKTKFTEKALQA